MQINNDEIFAGCHIWVRIDSCISSSLFLLTISAQGGSFTKAVCEEMAKLNSKPLIFALSNPTSKAECTATQAYEWTNG